MFALEHTLFCVCFCLFFHIHLLGVGYDVTVLGIIRGDPCIRNITFFNAREHGIH